MANIRTARRSGLVLRGGRQRRDTRWLFWATTETTLSGAPSVVLTNLLDAAALALLPFTVVRFCGVMHIASDQIVATETYGVALGFAIVTEQASAIGVTAVPTPVADQGSDSWFVYEQMFGRFGFGDITGFSQLGNFKEIDSRAMRKVEDGQDIVSVVENEINGVQVTLSGRMLIKLH